MPQQSAREQLVRFLDDRVFQAALAAQPLAYSTADERKLLKSVQKRVHESRTRYVAHYPEGYAIEELVAELGAAFLCADLDLTLEPREDHAAYIANWLDVLKTDNRAIFAAASHAQRAADFVNGLKPASAG